MKKSLLLLAFLLLSSAVQAQSLTLIVQWDPNLAADAVTSYQVTLTSAGSINTIPPQTVASVSCTATLCQATFLNVSQGNYTASVIATNEWSTSPAGIATITITFPGQVKNVRGKKG